MNEAFLKVNVRNVISREKQKITLVKNMSEKYSTFSITPGITRLSLHCIIIKTVRSAAIFRLKLLDLWESSKSFTECWFQSYLWMTAKKLFPAHFINRSTQRHAGIFFLSQNIVRCSVSSVSSTNYFLLFFYSKAHPEQNAR